LTRGCVSLKNTKRQALEVPMTNGRKPSDYQIPDLVIDSVTPKPSRRAPARGALNPQPFDLELEGISQQTQFTDPGAFDEFANGDSADLELSAAPRSRQVLAQPTDQWPSAVTPDPASISISQEQLQQVTLVGEPPDHLLETPIYAWLVYRNQMSLRRRVAEAQLRLEESELERDAAVANWTETLRAQLLPDQRFARLLEPWLSEEARLQQAVSGLDRSENAVASDQQAFNDAEGPMRNALAEATQRWTVASEHLADAERTLGREQAKRKRIDIEARASGSAVLDPATLNARIADADRAVEAAVERTEQSRRALATAGQAREAAELELRRLEDRKRRAEQTGTRVTEDARRNVDATERSLIRKKADVGRAVLALRESKYLDTPTIEQLLHHDQAVLRSATQYRCLVLAMDGFDRQAVKRGIILALGTIALLLLTLLRIIF
jgi:hypothetical protein